MLLLMDENAELSPAERRFAEWIRWSPAQPGVVLIDVAVPYRGRTRQLDAVIWTPQRCIAVEVKGFRSRQNGALVMPVNGPWLMEDGSVADLYGNDDTHNPIKQVRENTLAVKNWAAAVTGRQRFIDGLVPVMLLPGQHVPRVDAQEQPGGIYMLIDDFDVFRYYLHGLGRKRIEWTADEVVALIAALGLAHRHGGRRDPIAAALGEGLENSA